MPFLRPKLTYPKSKSIFGSSFEWQLTAYSLLVLIRQRMSSALGHATFLHRCKGSANIFVVSYLLQRQIKSNKDYVQIAMNTFIWYYLLCLKK